MLCISSKVSSSALKFLGHVAVLLSKSQQTLTHNWNIIVLATTEIEPIAKTKTASGYHMTGANKLT